MGLFAALLPPESALEELADVVLSVGGDSTELDAVAVSHLHIPITSFGNVARRESVPLADALRRHAAVCAQPQLQFSGGTALEWPGDECVWAKLDGDVDALTTIGRGVPPAVRHLGFLVDRRVFRPWLAVGQITSGTTAPYLERLVEALETFRGQLWTLEDVCLCRKAPSAPGEQESDRFEVIDRFPLAVGQPATGSPPARHALGSS